MSEKIDRPGVEKMIWTLNYLSNYIKLHGHENEYDHDFVLNHIDNVVEQVNKDKELKTSTEDENDFGE
jgi:hypothetical protein